MPSMNGSYSDSVIFAWYPSDDDTGDGEMPMQFHSEGDDLMDPVLAKELAQELSPKPDQHWQEVCFIQFLGLSDEEAADAIASNPGMEGLAGSGFHRIGPARTAAAPLHPRPQPPFPSAIVPLPGPPPPPPPPPTQQVQPRQLTIGPLAITQHPMAPPAPPPAPIALQGPFIPYQPAPLALPQPLSRDASIGDPDEISMRTPSGMGTPFTTPRSQDSGGSGYDGGGRPWPPPPPPPPFPKT